MKLLSQLSSFSFMLQIRHDNVIDRTTLTSKRDIARRHGGRIDKNSMLANRQQMPIEIELFFF
jgi:hypothetical protein